MLKKRRAGRPPAKQGAIEDGLRRDILNGTYPPNSRLPNRLDLSRHYNACLATVQLVVDRLVKNKFLVVHGSKGTFVADAPPRTLEVALAIPAQPDDSGFARIWIALANAAKQLESEQAGCLSLRIEYGIDGHYYHPAMVTLEDDVRRGRLGGIVFASMPFLLKGSPLLEQPGVPRVAFMTPSAEYPLVSNVHADGRSLYDLALNHCEAEGRRRIAFLSIAGDKPEPHLSEAKRRGFEVRPYWRLAVDRGYPETAQGLTHLLMRLPPKDRPNALFITDDNLVEYASAGVRDAGVRVPKDVLVIGHCNFPYPPNSVVPIHRVGYDARTVLRACLDEIAHLRAGGAPRVHSISATCEGAGQGSGT